MYSVKRKAWASHADPFKHHRQNKKEGRLVAETRAGDFKAVIAEIRGSDHITGIHEFILDPRDPFPEGFLI